MLSTEDKFNTGDLVIFMWGRSERLCVVTDVWKNGVFKIREYSADRDLGHTFRANGIMRGHSSSSCPYVVKFPEKESAEKWLENKKKKELQELRKRKQKEFERLNDIETWWHNRGRAIWANRFVLPGLFRGHAINAIYYKSDGGNDKTMFIINNKASDESNGTELLLVGFCGRVLNGKEYVNTFSARSAWAPTFEEAFYKLIKIG